MASPRIFKFILLTLYISVTLFNPRGLFLIQFIESLAQYVSKYIWASAYVEREEERQQVGREREDTNLVAHW